MSRNFSFNSDTGSDIPYTGDAFSDSIGYEEGDSLDVVIEKLSRYVLQERPLSTPSIDVSSLKGSLTTCGNKVTSTAFTYEVLTTESGGKFGYNFAKTIDNLPNGFNVIKQGVEIITASGKSQSLNGKINGANFPATAFPLNVTFSADVITSCGLLKFKKDVKVPIPKSKVETDFILSDFGQEDLDTPKSESEAISILLDAVASLDKKIDNRTYTRDGKLINESLVDVESEQISLQNEVSQIPVTPLTTIESLNSQIEELNSIVEKLETANANLEIQIKQIQADLNS